MNKIAFLQCVGSRDPSCGQDHCSTICCMYATKQAMIAKDRAPGLGVTFYYMDIRPMGKDYERYYERAKGEYGITYKRCAIVIYQGDAEHKEPPGYVRQGRWDV